MSTMSKSWSKKELKIYLFLLCADADAVKTEEELEFIKHKTDSDTFQTLYREFESDDQESRFRKIENSIAKHNFSQMELADLRKEIQQLFLSDKKYSAAEKYLDKILDNLIY